MGEANVIAHSCQQDSEASKGSSRRSSVRPTIGSLASAVALLLFAVACTGRFAATASVTPGPAAPTLLTATATASPTPVLPRGGLTESEAIAAARQFLPDDAAQHWATMPGTFETVFEALVHRPTYLEQPAPEGIGLDRMVWGVEFKVPVEICPPPGGTCETRDGLRTIIIDYATGEWLRTSTFAPSPGDSLPKP